MQFKNMYIFRNVASW